MEISVKRNGKEFPLSNSQVMAIILLFALSIIISAYAGRFIGTCWAHATNRIIDNAEKHADSQLIEDEKAIPVEVIEDESA